MLIRIGINKKMKQKMRYALELYENSWIEYLLADFDETKIHFTPEHEARMALLFQQAEEKARRAERKGRVLLYVKRAIAACLCTVIIGFCGCMFNQEIRAAVFEFIIEIYDKYFSISDNRTVEIDKPMEHRVPQYIPEGYEVAKSNLFTYTTIIDYQDSEKNLLKYRQYYNEEFVENLDIEDMIVMDVQVGDCYGKLCKSNNPNKKSKVLYWTDENRVYCLIGEISIEELLKMAESIS